MFSPLLNKKKNLEELHSRFVAGKPFPHLVIPSFLDNAAAKKLQKALIKEKFELKEADLFTFKQTDDLHYSSNNEIKKIVSFLESNEFSSFIHKITGISVKPGALDLFGSLYESTHYLLCHDDQLEDRKVAYIFYLSDDFSEENGGALALLEDIKGRPGKIAERHLPRFNSLALFSVSKKSWHKVEEVLTEKKRRYAIGGWLH